MLELNKIYCGDCLELMKQIADKSIDMILCDLPYGTTACSWDVVIPFEPLWEQYKRIIKDNGSIVLFGSQPFTTDLINSNRKWFRYEWIWEKSKASDFMLVNRQPRKIHENIAVFYNHQPTYNHIMEYGKPYIDKRKQKKRVKEGVYGKQPDILDKDNKGDRYPSSIQRFENPNNNTQHPTQKPVDLCKYLISTYTDKGELVLDNTCGSGTTCVASKELGRNFIGIDMSQEYVDIANKRLQTTTISLF